MKDVTYNQEKIRSIGQEYLNSFKKRLSDLVDEVMGEAYVNCMPYLEHDSWVNYREALRLELEHEYKFSIFKNPWAVNFRRAVFVENREEISKLISEDILKRIKELEDLRNEYEQFRYSL